MFPTHFQDRIDAQSFQPFYDLSVSIAVERIQDRMALQGLTRDEAVLQLVDEALIQLKTDALAYLNHGVSNV